MARINPRRLSPLAIALLLAVLLWDQFGPALDRDPARDPGREYSDREDSDALLAAAFRERRNNYQVAGAGTVVHLLPDDNQGSRHQRFLLELDSGQTLLVAHNIDLAPRVGKLERGDRVRFFGEYEWNEKGGVIHWTHHDPDGRHPGGWLEHRGARYE